MNFKTLALASALVFQTNDIGKHENVSLSQSEIYQALAEKHSLPKDKPVYYTFKISQELLRQIDTMCLDLQCPVVFTRSLEDVSNTPLFMKWTSRHIGEFLWYDQYDYILKTYNQDTIPDSLKQKEDLRINNFTQIHFPLIYDEIAKTVPHTLDSLMHDERFAAYRDTIHANDTLMISMNWADGNRIFLYYETGKLILGTQTTIGRWWWTPRWLFRVDYNVKYARSGKYNNAPMPYALHITKNIFLHQGKVSTKQKSHGCNRLPWFYAEAMYYLTTTPENSLRDKHNKKLLDASQIQLYDSLAKSTPKMLVVD